MDLFQELLLEIYREKIQIEMREWDLAQIGAQVNKAALHLLQQIKAILEDDELSDSECFLQIEAMVCAFEQVGSGIDYRHDF